MKSRVHIRVEFDKNDLRKVLPVVSIVVAVENSADMSSHANEVSKHIRSLRVKLEVLHKVFAIREGIEGHRDGSADTPRVILRKGRSIGLLRRRLGFDAGSVQLFEEELFSSVKSGRVSVGRQEIGKLE